MGFDRELIAEVQRYLMRRSEAGDSVLHRVHAAGGKSSMSRGGPGMETKRKQPVSRPAPGEEGPPVEGTEAERPAKVTKAKQPEKLREEAPSIHFQYEEKAQAQASLFNEGKKSATLDLGGLDLESLGRKVSTCTRCTLSEGRTKTVFGSGDPKSRIIFIGEAPGRDEDLQGLPFVGRAGKLLTKILASVGFSRDDVYITNILKCRPPGNRDPNEGESKACEPYLRKQLELIDPVLIVAMGRVAGVNLLKRNVSLSMLRQGIHYYDDTKVIVMYHPAALLRNPNLKRDAWEDIKRVREVYEEAFGT